MYRKKLQIDHLQSKMDQFSNARLISNPPTGWVKAIRTALGMSLQQLANRLSITKQSALEMERREQEGAITIKSLREAANALDMEFVYGLVPKDGTLHNYIDRKSRALAERIVLRTSTTMKLEGQENSEERLKKAIAERAASIKSDLPKALWD
jgi:predicted DNA-binding mobile mystery protein A